MLEADAIIDMAKRLGLRPLLEQAIDAKLDDQEDSDRDIQPISQITA